jgi:hypothetical protein
MSSVGLKMQHAYENATCGKHRYQTKQHIERDLTYVYPMHTLTIASLYTICLSHAHTNNW